MNDHPAVQSACISREVVIRGLDHAILELQRAKATLDDPEFALERVGEARLELAAARIRLKAMAHPELKAARKVA